MTREEADVVRDAYSFFDEFVRKSELIAEKERSEDVEHYREMQRQKGITAEDIEEHDRWMRENGVTGY